MGTNKQVTDDNNNAPVETRNTFQLFTTIVSLIWYLLYIAVVCTITFSATSTGNYYLTKVIHYLFINAPFKGYGNQTTSFRRSSNIDDFWAFLEKVIIPNFYQTLKKFQFPLFDDAVVESKTGIEHENRLIGRVRLRQIRVVQSVCPISTLVPLLSRICYPTYLRNHEDGTKLNVGDIEGGDYFNEDKSSSGEYWGSLGTYSGAGYTVLLPSDNKTVAQTILSQLKDYLWITRGTRVVFLEFSLFNPNINVFSSIRLAWEIPITGGVTTSWDIETAKLTLYSTFFEKLVFVFEIVFIFLTACVFIEEVITWFFLGFKKYLTRMWTYITLLIFALSCSCIACSLYRYFSLNFVVSELSITGNQFIDIHHLVQLETIYKNSSALLTLLVWIKLFKYLSFSGNISRIVETLSRCAKNIGGFSIIFLIILLAFAQLGHIVFGQQVLAFRTFPLSVFTLWRFILGQFDFSKVSNANRFLGPTFFLTFIVFVFIILVNMFLAIINDSYHECAQEEKAEMSKKPVDPDATDEDCVACLSSSCAQRKSEKTRAFQDMKEICIDPSEIKDYLEYRKKYFSNVDIEMFMERFNIAENDALDGNEAHKLLTDIIYNTYIAKTELFEQIRKRHPDDNPLPTVTNIKQSKLLEKAHAEMLTERVGVIESTVVELVPKIEKFLTIIELQIEGQKNANIINNQNNAPKRRSLGSGFYKYDK